MNIDNCEVCGIPVIHATTAAKGKPVKLHTSFSTTAKSRFYMANGKAMFVDRFDKERGRAGYPFHECKER